MIPACLGFLSGTVAVQQAPALLPWPVQLLGWAGLLAVCVLIFHHRHVRVQWPTIAWPLRYIMWLVAGSLWAMAYAGLRLDHSLPSSEQRYDAQVEGEVISIPEAMDRGTRFEYLIHHYLASSAPLPPRRLRLSWYNSPKTLKAGEVWQLRVRIRTPHGSLNPGSMDYEGWLYTEGMDAVGYVVESTDNLRLTPGSALTMATWRQALHDRLTRVLASSPYSGVIEALVMGIESGITQPQWEILRRTGTTHLIAISGSHIGLIAGLVFFLSRWLAMCLGLRVFPPHQLAALCGILTAWGYTALADFAIPTRRALVMVAVVMGSLLLKRHLSPVHTLALAGWAVAWHDPTVGLSPGFWLSFAAVGLIFYGMTGRLAVPSGVRAMLQVNGLTALGLAPLLLLFFQQVSLISPLANALAIPVLGVLLVPVCLAGAVLLPVNEWLGTAVLHGAEFILSWFWPLLEWLSNVPLAQWNRPASTWPELLLALAGVLLLLAPRGMPARSLGLVLCLPLVVNRPEPLAEGDFRLSVLDVGQGLSAVVETHSHVLVFDTGARFSRSFDMGRAVVEPYLRYRGWDGVDVLMISHGDNDHIGGADSLLRQFSVGSVYSSVPERLQPKAQSCQAGQAWDWDGIHLEVLAPIQSLMRENDNSCVLKVRGHQGCALLTGDIEARGEAELVRRYGRDLACDVLVVPHHGSKTSSTADFLDTVKPACALIPNGHLNRYGFPHATVVERYKTRHIPLYATASLGALTVQPQTSTPCAVGSYRLDHRRYWNNTLNP
ncbi:MAG: DNA internalization-related competence protein ComEC/Rec2 [Methylococcaceae bacterium]